MALNIGLPLGIVFAEKGLKVVLYDVNKAIGKIISSGKLPYVEYVNSIAEEFKK